jgi:hypothetical protein
MSILYVISYKSNGCRLCCASILDYDESDAALTIWSPGIVDAKVE